VRQHITCHPAAAFTKIIRHVQSKSRLPGFTMRSIFGSIPFFGSVTARHRPQHRSTSIRQGKLGLFFLIDPPFANAFTNNFLAFTEKWILFVCRLTKEKRPSSAYPFFLLQVAAVPYRS
jgi:hypothetical protein